MKRYRQISHTADTGLVAYGDTLEQSYVNAAYGMFSLITDLRRVKAAESRTIEIEERNLETLLFEWLNSLLYYFDTQGMLFKVFDIVSFSERRINARCLGEIYQPSRHCLKTGIKSATFHQMLVDRQTCTIRVIFDV